MPQLLLHLWGDYILQSEWMAQNKTRAHVPALVHANLYALPFALLTRSWLALLVIFATHFLIDRYRLARYVVWAKNWLGVVPRFAYLAVFHPAGTPVEDRWIREGDVTMTAPELIDWRKMPWEACSKTGYTPDAPVWLSTWLLIIADNTLHLTINYCALRWL